MEKLEDELKEYDEAASGQVARMQIVLEPMQPLQFVHPIWIAFVAA